MEPAGASSKTTSPNSTTMHSGVTQLRPTPLERDGPEVNGSRCRSARPAAIEEFFMTMFVKITCQTRGPELLHGLVASITDVELQRNRKGRKVPPPVAALLWIDHG